MGSEAVTWDNGSVRVAILEYVTIRKALFVIKSDTTSTFLPKCNPCVLHLRILNSCGFKFTSAEGF